MGSADSSQVVKAIRKIVRAIDLRSKEVSKQTGLTIPQIVVLQSIKDLGAVTVKALSENADLSSPTVVTILDKLEGKGLVQRQRSVSDRRVVHTALTEVGENTLADLPGLLHDEFEKKFANLAAEDRAQLILSIERIAEMMNAHKLDASAILVTGKLEN